jgi:methylase of polypeptide subunit release factors/chorismate mutase
MGKNAEPVKYVENTAKGILVQIIKEIIEEEKLPFGGVDIDVKKETPDGRPRYPDITIWKRNGKDPACHIELKNPKRNPFFDGFEQAQLYANLIPTSPFFATWNINRLVLWKNYIEATTLDEKIAGVYEIAKIKDPKELKDPEVQKKIKKSLRKFLRDLAELIEGGKELQKLPIDELFIYTFREFVDTIYDLIAIEIREKFRKSKEFRNKLFEWFIYQGWNVPTDDDIGSFEKVARQFLYLLVNKIMFYNVLRKNFSSLEPIILEDIADGEALKRELQKYFDKAEKITKDFEAIFGFDLLERIPIPNSIVPDIKRFVNGLLKYDFSKLEYKDIGYIFDKLIPDEERYKLGQYFTNPYIVDIINTFCIRDPNAKVADFGCGAGTFLVRAYARIKHLDRSKSHKEILKQLIGVDISKFAAHLTTINLAIRDLSTIENPIVICKDFFDIKVSKVKEWRRYNKFLVESLGGENIEIELPDELDAVVGNPPYTRQEELDAYVENYKEKLQKILKEDWGENIKLNKRAGIYAYFFIHSLRFLKNGGRLGYITSNSWLNVDYGKDLQEFFLKHCKIVAIIETKERVFPDADINTVITILEKCDDEKERNNNLVKFVKLKVPLKELIPPDEEGRFKFLDDLVNKIEKTKELYEDDKIRIYPKLQGELLKEGYDEEKKEYIGSKWGKYIRAPEIFFKILEKGKGILVPLKEIAEVRFGIKTGANEFFYLTEDEIQKWDIEREFWMHPLKKEEEVPVPEQVWKDKGGEYFKESQYAKIMKLEDVLRDDGYVYWIPNYVIKSPRECKSILIDPRNLKYRVLLIHKDKSQLRGTKVLKYIEWGELYQGFHKRPTCASRKRWYELDIVDYPLVWRSTYNTGFAIFLNKSKVAIDKVLYGISPYDKDITKIILAIMNSSIISIFTELYGTVQLGEGALFTAVYEVEKIPIVAPSKLSKIQMQRLVEVINKLSSRKINSIFEELGANSPEEVSLDKVKPDRRELDKIIMCEILGLTEDEQLEVYKAVIQLVKERIERAKSVEKEKKKDRKITDESYAEKIISEIDISKLKEFPDSYLPPKIEIEKTIQLPEEKENMEIGRDLFGYYVKFGNEKIRYKSSIEAKWIYYSAISGNKEVKIPRDELIMEKILKDFEEVYNSISKEIEEKLNEYISESKLRRKVKEIIERKVGIKLKES